MTTLSAAKADIQRTAIWILKVHQDYCTLHRGVAPCAATVQCYYTYGTCQDLAHYTKSDKVYAYCNRGARTDGKPLLEQGWESLAITINPEKFKTENGEMTFKLRGDLAERWANPDKLPQSNADSGNYWPNWLARHENYEGRLVELYQGFVGVALADYELVWRGKIYNIEYQGRDFGIEMKVRDLLYELSEKGVPAKTPSNIKLLEAITAGAMSLKLDDGISPVYDASLNFLAPTSNAIRTVKIEDEYITYAGITDNQLTGLTRGRWGTTAANHDVGVEVKQVQIYAEPGSDWTAAVGYPGDHLIMDLLWQAGVDAAYIATMDLGVTLTMIAIADDEIIFVNNYLNLPPVGVLKIDDELLRYTYYNYVNILAVKRGCYGTTAADHAVNTPVLPTTFTVELGRYRIGALFRARFESSAKVNEKLTTLRRSLMMDIWQNENGEIEGKLQTPPWPGTAIKSLDALDMIEGSRKLDRNDDSRITRCLVWFDPSKADPGDGETNRVNYGAVEGYADYASEGPNIFGKAKLEDIYAEWIYNRADAVWLASHRFVHFSKACPKIKFALETKDSDYAVGRPSQITIPEIVNSAGAQLGDQYSALSRKRTDVNRFEYEVEKTGFGDHRFWVIGPPNGALDVGINDAVTTFDVDLTGTGMTAADWRTPGAGEWGVMGIEDELVTYNVVTDLGGGVVRLSGGARGQGGTAAAAHSAGVDARMNFAAASDSMRVTYGWLGNAGEAPTGNLVDGNGDFVGDTQGVLIW